MLKLRVFVSDIATVINTYDHVEIGRAATQADAASQTGTFVSLGQVIALVANTETYTWVDVTGAKGQWYVSRYTSTVNGNGGWSQPFQGLQMGYLTAAEFRDYELTDMTRPDGTPYTDDELDRHIATASSLINGYLNGLAFYLAQDTEQHRWNQDTRRIYPYQRPIVSADALQVYISVTQFATFNPADMYVNVQSSYIEVVSLNTVTYSLFPAIVNLGMINPVAKLTYTHGYVDPPQDVKDATALTTAEVLGELALNWQGFTGVNEARIGDYMISRRVTGSRSANVNMPPPIPGLDVPQSARRLIDHYNVITLR